MIKDGLESLESLKSLNLSGNHLDNLNEFYKLKYLENLTQLTLNDVKNTASNPICRNSAYKSDLGRILPKLEVIDGVLFCFIFHALVFEFNNFHRFR